MAVKIGEWRLMAVNIGEGVNNGEAVNKYLIDGKLIIRTAEGVFDAQGKRL